MPIARTQPSGALFDLRVSIPEERLKPRSALADKVSKKSTSGIFGSPFGLRYIFCMGSSIPDDSAHPIIGLTLSMNLPLALLATRWLDRIKRKSRYLAP